MPTCPNGCRVALTRQANGLLHCNVCGFTYKPNQKTPLLSRYVSQATAIQIPDADQDLKTFVARVGQKLVPIHNDYTETVKKDVGRTRQSIQKDLLNVFEGKNTIQKWFTKTRRLLGVHQIDMTRILYESLEGLQSREAREMRKQYEQALQTIQASYNPNPGMGSPT